MSFGPDRRRKRGRRAPTRAPRRRFLVVCEGEKTEPQYLKGFANVHRGSIVEVEVVAEAGVPLSVVLEAKRRKAEAESASRRGKDRFQRFDSVWCVFDVDEHPNIAKALDMARANEIEVAMSNPCIELWLVLHLRDAPGMIHRHDIQAMLKEFVPKYDKNVDFETYRRGYETAVVRARRLDALAESVGEPGRNPTTGVYKLTQSIAPPPRTTPRRRVRD